MFEISVPVCLSAGLIERVFPIHDTEKLHLLRETWVRAVLSPQPLGFYFVFVFIAYF